MNMSEQSFLSVPARHTAKREGNAHTHKNPKRGEGTGHTHRNMQLVRGASQVERARAIQKSLGTLVAARYLKARKWSIEVSLYILVGA